MTSTKRPDGGELCGCGPTCQDVGGGRCRYHELRHDTPTNESPAPQATKKTYIKPLRTIVEIDARYADQIRDLLNAPADFEAAWAKRPWVAVEEADKDRARRWWNAGCLSAPAPQPPVEGLREALGLSMDALNEATAILGGEYGDYYKPLCDMMLELKERSARLLASPSLTAEVEPEELEEFIADRSANRAAEILLKNFTITRRPAPATLIEQSGAALDLQGPGKMGSEKM